MDNVINLLDYKKLKSQANWKVLYSKMDKLELLEEMVAFQEERAKIGHLTLELCVKGIPLFEALTKSSETEDLRKLTSSYVKHLKYEAEHSFGVNYE